MIAAFQLDGNNVEYKPGDKVPTYSPEMGYMADAQLDIFGNAVDSGSSSGSPTSVSAAAPSHSSTSSPASGCRI